MYGIETFTQFCDNMMATESVGGKVGRPKTSLFLLSSLDGKISTGSSDTRDVDKDFPYINGVKEGLHQYYEIEQTTELWSMCSGRVQAKIGVNKNPYPDFKSPVSFVIIDNTHLNEHGVRFLSKKAKTLVIVTGNKNHPAYSVTDENVHIIHHDDMSKNPEAVFQTLYREFGCKSITVQTGSELNAILLRNHLIDEIDLVVAPVLIGGVDTSSVVGGVSLNTTSELSKLSVLKLKNITKLKNSYLRLTYDVL